MHASTRTPADDDRTLLAAWRDSRSSIAFDLLVTRYAPLVRGVATRALGGHAAAADDVTQAVFLLLSRRAHRIRVDASLAPWLHVTTRYAAANARRTIARRSRHEQIAATHRREAAMRKDASNDVLDDAIARLGAGDRLLILERYYRDAEVADIAAAIGATPASTQRRLSRAIARLRDLLGRRAAAAAAAGLPASLIELQRHAASPRLLADCSAVATSNRASASVEAIARSTRIIMALKSLRRVGGFSLLALALATTVAVSLGRVDVSRPSRPPSSRPDAPIAAATPSTAPTFKPEALVGRWRFVATRAGGRDAPADQLGAAAVTITPTEIIVEIPRRKPERSTYLVRVVDAAIEIDQRDAENPSRMIPGVLRLDGDVLTIAFDDRSAKTRPADVDHVERNAKLWVLHRVGPDATTMP